MQFCGEPGCGVLVSSGKCATHAPRQRYTRAGYAETHKWYGSIAWQQLRGEVLREDPFCRVCRSQGRRTVASEVDHIRPHRGDARLFWDRTNLQSLDASCHAKKTKRGE